MGQPRKMRQPQQQRNVTTWAAPGAEHNEGAGRERQAATPTTARGQPTEADATDKPETARAGERAHAWDDRLCADPQPRILAIANS